MPRDCAIARATRSADAPALRVDAHGAACTCGERRAARAAVGAVDARDLVGRNDVLVAVAPGEHDEGREGADERRAPTIHQMCQISAKPMMVAKNAQTKPVGLLRGISIVLVVAARRRAALLERALLDAPVGVLALDVGQHGEVEGRRRRRRRPFQRAAVPGIAGHVAQLPRAGGC